MLLFYLYSIFPVATFMCRIFSSLPPNLFIHLICKQITIMYSALYDELFFTYLCMWCMRCFFPFLWPDCDLPCFLQRVKNTKFQIFPGHRHLATIFINRLEWFRRKLRIILSFWIILDFRLEEIEIEYALFDRKYLPNLYFFSFSLKHSS